MRIDKLLANMGYGSRKDVKLLLKQGAVQVDGQPVKDAKRHVKPETEVVTVFGEAVDYKPFVYLMMNKPEGVVSATEDQVETTVLELIDPSYAHYELFPVGRLDKDTTGLLLLTNDGAFNHALMSPRKHVDKVYVAEIDGEMTVDDVRRFAEGVELEDGYTTKPARLEVISRNGRRSMIRLTLSEGKYHQVKRMVAAVGKHVERLERIQIGTLELDPTLERGAYRELTQEEYDALLA
ncbi:MAG: rRNA pseudouridine synthase [Exiguobacterium sp.]|uniref:Pseudouridine synthase n=1 Tax=Exiguobacterium alkaliphilum TaxID=1428684 RepID=A0ABT2KZR3_9BACL|nr:MULTISPECIES: pseudouridine synthase [Exiguobacterium]MDX5324215.1 rRNA pseudouridine synthase [Exiguobacterium sp.]MCT4795130.1 rRNA pseudouridine synthase [Exiguobacterium alkaliphilum]MDX5426040.1 rRNA pseudouridine synthase [Exiguobacterium sp.]MDX6773434.1 rRNA pseudouridine synthase [Exiguobacterium sp.]QUE87585.1 rRNA pseudouridine synthase [Exiguobacterium alkaliphilum]